MLDSSFNIQLSVFVIKADVGKSETDIYLTLTHILLLRLIIGMTAWL